MIYLDYNATTPIDKDVLAAMMPYFQEQFGNPSSSHLLGKSSKEAINESRRRIRTALKAEDFEVVFTGSGSEANNMAIKGATYNEKRNGNHIIISSIEHKSVTVPVHFLQDNGYEVTVVPVDRFGIVSPEDVEKAVTDKTILISVMLANNEIGSIQFIKEIAAIGKKNGILVHTDAAQAVGKMHINIVDLGVDMMTIVGHKFSAPKGIGALLIRSNLKIESLIHGANHENGFRAGTENTPYIAGFGKAMEIASSRIDAYTKKVGGLRDRLQSIIMSDNPKILLNGDHNRLCNTLNISLSGIDFSRFMEAIHNKIACSTGSACDDDKPDPSDILLKIGRSKAEASSAVRLTLGWETTEEDVEEAGALILKVLTEVR
ncbi:cysteine desulfurase family protein [Flavobacterium collinsii]|uniref:cysteine desulfurase family protein n=1 Tax=Flavobacterium collinsii TaxID=1114861 RepID=UPI0037563B9E